MRFGISILPEAPWAVFGPRWQAAEAMGFDHAWTYDHLVWEPMTGHPWYGTTPTLTAAALATSTIKLGTLVSSPNFRHPFLLYRDVQSLDDVSGGRFLLGIGNGGNLDSAVLGGPDLSVGERVSRLQEFVDLYRSLATSDDVTWSGRWFSTVSARTLPRLRSVPLLLAANGPRSIRYAARAGDGWVTTGPKASSLDEWFAGLASSAALLDEALVAADRDPSTFPRYLLLDASPVFSLASADTFDSMVRRAAGLGFTDVITHWPRASEPYSGSEDTLHTVVADVIPGLRSV